MRTNYFFGSNTSQGFMAAHDDVVNADKLVILKGGAGTGKSTLMKKVATEAEKEGYDVQLFHCSSDSNSLDAVYVPQINSAIADGTAPHVIEARLPAVKHFLFNLSDKANERKLRSEAATIETCLKYKKQYFDSAYCHLKCAYALDRNICNTILSAVDNKEINATVSEIFDCVKDAVGRQTGTRFISAITDKGIIEYVNENFTDSKYIALSTDYPCVSEMIIASLARRLALAEIPFTTYLSPLSGLPAEALKIGDYVVARAQLLLRADYYFGINSVTNQQNIGQLDGIRELLDRHVNSAIDNIRYARLAHIETERIYYSAMDWADVNDKSERIMDILFG